ncbi:MAG: hypothetical protein MJZ82_02585 [Paludibacteraceae bacterium]|nr:hypothetical protein [Paludibacteraceae bacterium]
MSRLGRILSAEQLGRAEYSWITIYPDKVGEIYENNSSHSIVSLADILKEPEQAKQLCKTYYTISENNIVEVVDKVTISYNHLSSHYRFFVLHYEDVEELSKAIDSVIASVCDQNDRPLYFTTKEEAIAHLPQEFFLVKVIPTIESVIINIDEYLPYGYSIANSTTKKISDTETEVCLVLRR